MASIQIMLRCLIGKRLFTSRKDTLRKVRKQERSLSNAPLPKPFIRGPSNNSVPEEVALSTVTNSYGDDDNPSDDSESYGFIKQTVFTAHSFIRSQTQTAEVVCHRPF